MSYRHHLPYPGRLTFVLMHSDMRLMSFNLFYGYCGLAGCVLVGNVILFWGFGSASERMNKRIRDGAFTSLLRQEVGWFDLCPPGSIATQLADDAALLHAFSGEPVRTLILNLSSVLVGLIISLFYMWPFALVTLGILPFLVRICDPILL
jgi:ATP-binding cassette subfamily B (MDR/TAP) protein 1